MAKRACHIILLCFVWLFVIHSFIPQSHAEIWPSEQYFYFPEKTDITPLPAEEIDLLIEKAKEQGDATILHAAAIMYDNGDLIEQDPSLAEILYLKAIEFGNIPAKVDLGIFYNFKGDITKAKKWFLDGAESGDARGWYELGLFRERGRGFGQNQKKANEYFKQASDAGILRASLKLAINHHYVEEPDMETAITYYEKAAEQATNDKIKLRISLTIARIYVKRAKKEGNAEDIFKWYLKAAELGDIDSQLWVASAYLNSEYTESDYEKAIEWYTKLSNKGNTHAMTMLGYIYSNGLGPEIDYEQAVQWYTWAAERGNAEAAWALGNMYLAGAGVVQNAKEGQKWIKRSENLRDR